MSWIRSVPYAESTGRLRRLYDRIAGPDGYLDAILTVHGLRPHTLEGHMTLYKAALHHGGNTLPAWLLETIGVWVSLLNGCGYCVDHHAAGLRRVLGDDARCDALLEALRDAELERALAGRELAALRYAEMLSERPHAVDEADISALRDAGLDDGEILEVNQVTSYFAYANRLVLGLGVTAEGDVLGLSPRTAEPEEWRHA